MNSREILLYYALKFNGNWGAIYDAISSKEELDEKEAQKVISKVNSKYVTLFDPEYPKQLSKICKPPFVLFYQGDISLLSDDKRKIAVVGSRKFTEYGQTMTEKLVKGIAKDFVVVSGLAIGIDAIAHKAAIDAGGRTIAVLGNGVNFHYIKENKELYDEIKTNHLVISEYPDMVQPNPEYFPVRNRIIVGMTNHLLVTEGKIASGTQITALLMVAKSGDVCCVPTQAGENSICNYLIKEGAYLVETPEDIYVATGVDIAKPIFEL